MTQRTLRVRKNQRVRRYRKKVGRSRTKRRKSTRARRRGSNGTKRVTTVKRRRMRGGSFLDRIAQCWSGSDSGCRKTPLLHPSPATIRRIMGHVLYTNYEYCGTFKTNGNYLEVGVKAKGTLRDERRSCSMPRGGDLTYCWHTHPNHPEAPRANRSKIYPSEEDFEIVLNNDSRIYEYIFTQSGYWILYYDSSIAHDPHATRPNGELYIYSTPDDFLEGIDTCNSNLYEKTNRGRDYNKTHVQRYIKELMDMYVPYGYDITFKEYP